MWEIWVQFLGWEDPLEKGKVTHSSILEYSRIPWTIPWGCKESDTTDRLSLKPNLQCLISFKCTAKWVSYFIDIYGFFFFRFFSFQFSSVQMLTCVQLFLTPWTAACQASLSITNAQSFLKLMSIELVMPSNHLILSSPSPPAFDLSQHQGLFKWVSSSHQVAKGLEFQLQHQSFQWIFRIDFL